MVLSVKVVALFCAISIVNVCSYFVDKQYNCSSVATAIDPPTKYVTFLGKFDSTQECIEECIKKKCDSYTYFLQSNGNYSRQCWSYINITVWLPQQSKQSNCGRIIYPCINDSDCSLNGKCDKTTTNCTCNRGWNGYKCQFLSLLPGNKSAGYLAPYGSKNWTSWGGSVAYDNVTNKYVMLAAQMSYNCGINSWLRNSEIIYAETVDNNWNSEFILKSTLIVPFAHEPDIIYAPDTDEFVLIYVENTTWDDMPPCICSDGHTTHCNENQNVSETTAMRRIKATDLSKGYDINKWSLPTNLNHIGGDSNFAAVINDDSSLVGMVRHHLVTATNWRDNKTYKVHQDNLFPYLFNNNYYGPPEDFYLYKDCDGYFHALFHNMDPSDDERLCGGHAYSVDGINWQYSGLAFSNFVEFTDGTQATFHRRERPHLIFEKDKCTPVALTSGTQYDGDKCYTLLQPIKH